MSTLAHALRDADTTHGADKLVLALDIGGTKAAGGLVDGNGDVIHRAVVSHTEPPASGDVVFARIARMLSSVLDQAAGAEVVAVGVGCAGPLDVARGRASPVNIPGWRDFPLLDALATVVGEHPIYLANDAACAAAGEHWLGVGRGADDLLLIVVSTGVGGGLVLAGRLQTGATGNAGHVGHIVVDLDGPTCPCGGRGCVEAIASGTSLLAWARTRGWQAGNGSFPGAQLAQDARDGVQVAVDAFDRAGRALAAGIASAAAAFDVRLAVLGGGVMRSADVLLPAVRGHLPQFAALGFLRDLHVEAAALGDDSGLLGAAALALQPERYPVGSRI